MEKSEKIFVTRGFIEKFIPLFEDENASFGDIAKLLVFQPRFVLHLLNTANKMCDSHGSFKKPTSIQGVINILGFSKILDETKYLGYPILSEEKKLIEETVECYIIASMYAHLAEELFGKRKAPEHFLAGLVARLAEDDESILDDCNDELKDYLSDSYTKGINLKGVSTIEDLKEIIKKFEKRGEVIREHTFLYGVWYEAKNKVTSNLTTF